MMYSNSIIAYCDAAKQPGSTGVFHAAFQESAPLISVPLDFLTRRGEVHIIRAL
jgi:hypothetical protein